MKIVSSKSLLNFLLASIFALSAQSFLLVPQRQEVLLRGRTPAFSIVLSILFLLVSYLNLSQVFYHRSPRQQKLISLLSLIPLALLVFLYAQASLFVEVILFASLGVACTLTAWQNNPEKDFLGYSIIAANIAIGAGFFFWGEFLGASLYQRVESSKIFFSLLFLGTAAIKLLSLLQPTKFLKIAFPKLIVLPWLGWAFFFSSGPEISISLPSILISVALLSPGLLPFKKFRLPEKGMLGSLVFPVFSLFLGFLLALFYYLLHSNTPPNPHENDLVFIFYLILSVFLIYSVMKLHFMLYELTDNPSAKQENRSNKTAFEKFANSLFAPVQESLPLSEWQAKKIQRLSIQLVKERESAKRFTMLNSLRKQLDDQFDDPVSAQLVANTTQKYFDAEIVAIFLYDIETHELSALASAGKMKTGIPTGYRQSINDGIMGRAARLRKTQIVNDTTLDQDYIKLLREENLSEIAIPLIHHGYLKGVLIIDAEEKNAFSAADIRVLEVVVEELLKTWERSGHNRRLRTLIQSNVSLSTSFDPQYAIDEITLIARKTLQARFVFVTLFDQDGTFTRTASAGYAPNLHHFLSKDLSTNPLLQVALEAMKPFRVRDIRKYKYAPSITLDHNMLRGLIIIPIRLHGVSIGAILGFGKQGGIFFSEKDESLANLLATQAATAIESAWLIQELRSTTITTTLLYQLSFGILQTDTITEAAQLIAETAYRLAKASVAGIVLFSLDKKIQISLEVTSDGVNFSKTVPTEFIRQTLTTGESITLSSGEASAHIYLPIQTSLRKYGVLWVEFIESERQASSQAQTLQTLANQASMALERTLFLLDSRQKTSELKDAFTKLEETYDQTLTALMSALDARDRETEGHSVRVGEAAYLLGKEFNLSKVQRNSLQRGSLLHDIGKIGVSDTILNKTGKLTDEEWEIMRQHPIIGREIIKDIPFLQDAIPVVYAHHERWNGSGYPLGLRDTEIPLEARIFAVADIFDALTSNRPYRKSISDQEALAYLQEQAGILVDPDVVAAFERLLNARKIRGATIPVTRF